VGDGRPAIFLDRGVAHLEEMCVLVELVEGSVSW
jgi:hypothetical protein